MHSVRFSALSRRAADFKHRLFRSASPPLQSRHSQTRRSTMPTTAQEIFDAMSNRFLPEQAGDLNATILFDLSGEGGGQWLLTVANRQATVTRDAIPNPTMTFIADA